MRSLLEKRGLGDKIHVYSSGTSVDIPRGASENAIIALNEIGLDLTKHKSQLITRELVEEADLVLAMTEGHKRYVLSIMPEAKDKVFTLIEYATGGSKGDISDPYLMNIDTYRNCRDEILKYLEPALEKLGMRNTD